MVTCVPGSPLVGDMVEIVGAAVTVNENPFVVIPPAAVATT